MADRYDDRLTRAVEAGMAAEIFTWYAEEGRRAYGRVLPQRMPGVRMTVVKEPVGPVAPVAPVEPVAPVKPAPVAPVAPVAPLAPAAPAAR